jgi:ATP/maltotriose-dependent transcriptional regulator MalT
MPTRQDLLAETARSAAAEGDWAAARRAFEALAAEAPTAEVLAGLGDVLWWLGETVEGIRCQERAFAAYQHRGDAAGAGTVGVGLYLTYRVSLGNTAAARGWLSRLARLVDEAGLEPLAGWVALLRAHDSTDAGVSEALARQARELATRFGDVDLELCAISQLGAAMVAQGRRDEGTALMDEAMAASLAGESTRPHTVVYASCTLIGACAETADTAHALQWIRAADAFEQRYGSAHLYTTCRTYLGAMLVAAGDWTEAERELRAALEVGAAAEPAVYAEAAARLAELRLAQGRLDEAGRLLEGFEDFDTSAVALAGLAWARGDIASARCLAMRRARALTGDDTEVLPGSHRAGLGACLEEALLWEVLTLVAEPANVEEAVRRLTDLAETTGCDVLRARALRAGGRVRSDATALEQSLALFNRLRMPLESARTRLELAALLTAGDAAVEARAALSTFESLGANRDADAAAARLRDLGTTVTRGPRREPGPLTRREREVLALLAEGLSNREVAERLFLSRKTVERHVRNVLAKLGLRNRTEAAAYVIRHEEHIRSES